MKEILIKEQTLIMLARAKEIWLVVGKCISNPYTPNIEAVVPLRGYHCHLT